MFKQKKPLHLCDLIVTHNKLRNPYKLWSMYKSLDIANNIIINRIGATHYIHDGHHRLMLRYWLGHDILEPDKYTLTTLSRKKYCEINFDAGWVTPYDLITEVRVADFFGFKEAALNNGDKSWIHTNRHLYAEKRSTYGLPSFARQHRPQICISKKLTTESELALDLPDAPLYALVRLRGTDMTVAGMTFKNHKLTTASISTNPDVERQLELCKDIF